VNWFFIIIKLLDKRGLLEGSYLPVQCFLQSPVEMRDLIRLGGLISHLQKESPISEEELPKLSSQDADVGCLVDTMLMLFHLVVTRKMRQADTLFRKAKDVSKRNVNKHNSGDVMRDVTWSALRIWTPQKQILMAKALGYICRFIDLFFKLIGLIDCVVINQILIQLIEMLSDSNLNFT
jgi:hypothetical protein